MFVKIGDNNFPVGRVFASRRNQVCPECITQVTMYLADFFRDCLPGEIPRSLYDHLRDNYYREFIVPGDGSSDTDYDSEITMDWSTDKSKGKVVTRLSKYFYKRFGYKLPAAQKEHIGNLLANNGATSLYWLVISPGITWQSGAYGDSNSCFWGSRTTDRIALNESDVFYSVRVLRDNSWPPADESEDRGLARCLLYFPLGVEHGMTLVFNGYGMSSRTFTQILSQLDPESPISKSTPIHMEFIGEVNTASVFVNPSSSHAILPSGWSTSSNVTILFDGAEKKDKIATIGYNRDVYGLCSRCGGRALVASSVSSTLYKESFDALVRHFEQLGFHQYDLPSFLSLTPPCSSCGVRYVRSSGRRYISVPLERATLRKVESYGIVQYELADVDEVSVYPLTFYGDEEPELYLAQYLQCFHVMDEDGVRSLVYVRPSDVDRFRSLYTWSGTHFCWLTPRVTSSDDLSRSFGNRVKNRPSRVFNVEVL